ncbi:unnamed protein product [Somion occarium]|uniref:Uncharacterized protein n=1 Tax=Somion occarium TaxID=3059160 RepID=A0ABP1CFD6_9APHY
MTVMPDTTMTDDSSLLSPNVTGPGPTWGPPRAPLPPHRLAKLANALGVSTPVPITHSYSLPPFSPPSQPNSSTSSSFPDHFRRSPTPSMASGSTHTPTASTSKYLLHVIPPQHLPHDISDEFELTPFPATASGYHGQFRRGIMVPVYPTLQSQLSAIAREYALPSTLGMVLYLITNSSLPSSDVAVSEEPGPRISEEIWKHIWTRVLRVEQNDGLTPGPRPLGLGFNTAGRSSPSLMQEVAASASLRSLISPKRFDTSQPSSTSYPTPSPSTPSNSAYSSQSDLDTPESASSVSLSGDGGVNAIPLPGLTSPSLIPILAKVEFDIDRKKAGWYEPWVRSRKVNHAKRAESRLGMRSRMDTVSDAGEADEPGTKKAPIDLELVGRLQTGSPVPSFLLTTEGSAKGASSEIEEDEENVDLSSGYQQLSESPVHVELEHSDSEHEEAEAEEVEDMVQVNRHGDPLADVFGTDEEAWADLHAGSESRGISKRQSNSHIVELALDGAALSAMNDLEADDEADKWSETGEVTELLNTLNRPTLSVSIPSSPPNNGQSSTSDTATTAATIKRHIPPPLNLAASVPSTDELAVPALTSPMPGSSGSVHLAYLNDQPSPLESTYSQPEHSDNDDFDEEVMKVRSPLEEKRGGAVFDDLNLGLDPSMTDDGSEFDDSDPNDRRKSQYIMAAQLDEIEKTLAQFSPRQLKPEILDESPRPSSVRSTGSPRSNGGPPRSPPQSLSAPGETPSWPAVPFSALNGNGEPPKSFQPKRPSGGIMSDESLARKRELEEERGLYPPLAAPNLFLRDRTDSESPIIPLSPDPFGRFPSQAESVYMEEEQRKSQIFQEDTAAQSHDPIISPPDRSSSLTLAQARESGDRSAAHTPSSRFSFDSVTSEDATKSQQQQKSAPLMSVKSIRRLWRRSDKQASISGNSTYTIPESGRTSPNVPQSNGQPMNGRTRSKSFSKQMLPPPAPVNSSGNLPVPPMIQAMRETPYRGIQLDGDSRYPLIPIHSHPVPPAGMARQPSPPPERPPSMAKQRPPSVSPQPPSESNRNSGVRKSILKSWKSASGSLSVSKGSSKPTSSTTTPRSSTEQAPEGRRRRPSVLELATNMRNSVTNGFSDIPPSPALPDQYAPLPNSRASSRQSQMTLNGIINGAPAEKRPESVTRRGPSVSSTSTTASSSRIRSPLNAGIGTSPPRNGVGSRLSDASWEERPSFDVSQFEIVSPPKSHFLESTLSYPYHGLDHSMTSQES